MARDWPASDVVNRALRQQREDAMAHERRVFGIKRAHAIRMTLVGVVVLFGLLVVPQMLGCTPIEKTVGTINSGEKGPAITSGVGGVLNDVDFNVRLADNKGIGAYTASNNKTFVSRQPSQTDSGTINTNGFTYASAASFDSLVATFAQGESTSPRITTTYPDGTVEVVEPNTILVSVLTSMSITGFNTEIPAVLEAYGKLLDRDVVALQAMEETERIIFIQEIKSKEAVYGKLLETVAIALKLIPVP
jgi:hypothetical protein